VANQNFRVKTGLEVGIGVTITSTSVSAVDFTGNLTGNVNSVGVSTFSGGIQGNLTGNVTGNLTGNVNSVGVSTFSGGIQGNLTGNVTGNLTGNVNSVGVSTFNNVVVGGATTSLVVIGNARVTGILTVGTGSVTIDGDNNALTIGTGVTVFGNTGIVNAIEFRGNGANLTGVQPFPTGTLMLFQQTSAPTGWTKQTTHNNKALRVVSGTASSGGSTAFTSVFTSRTPTGTVSGSNSGGSVSAHTLTTAEIPSHTHASGSDTRTGSGVDWPTGGGVLVNDVGSSRATGATGSGQAHSHGFTNPTWSGTFSGSALDFSVQYVDLIIASKD
jgi:hypothetical protein